MKSRMGSRSRQLHSSAIGSSLGNSGRVFRSIRTSHMQRRLAAILIADVVGYTRLSQVDEMRTRAHFKADLREVFEPKIAEHGGRLVKTMGDGLLVEFPSVVEALNCAVEIQRAKAERTAGMSADRRMDFRIGINLGDVIVEGDDIHGDGVNIADRLQQLAEPGGIVVSGTTSIMFAASSMPSSISAVSSGSRTSPDRCAPIACWWRLTGRWDRCTRLSVGADLRRTGGNGWRSPRLSCSWSPAQCCFGRSLGSRVWRPPRRRAWRCPCRINLRSRCCLSPI